MFEIVTALVDEKFDVRQRLVQLSNWKDEWLCEDERLKARLRKLSPKKRLDIQRGDQIGIFRKRLKMRLIREPLEIATTEPAVGYKNIRQNLVEQFAILPKEMKLLWLDNFIFIMTPELWELHEKVKDVLDFQSLGQQRNFLIGAPSGMGKSTYLNWLSALHLPIVGESRNYVPVIKIDAPVSNKTPRALLQRLILECGLTYLQGDTEEDLNQKLGLYFQQIGVVLIIIDEIEHISHPEMKRRVLDLSNRTQGVPFICASCKPWTWVTGDEEVAGRWNDFFELPPYTGERLSKLLASLELLLPFTEPSNLALPVIKDKSGMVDGPAKFIELMTDGILRDIMILIRDASRRAIENNIPCLTPELLEKTWKRIQRKKTTEFLEQPENTTSKVVA